MSQNHISPNLSHVGQPSNPVQNNGMNNSSLNLPSMMNMQNNIRNSKPVSGPAFPGNVKNFAGIMPHQQFANQQPMLRNHLPAGML